MRDDGQYAGDEQQDGGQCDGYVGFRVRDVEICHKCLQYVPLYRVDDFDDAEKCGQQEEIGREIQCEFYDVMQCSVEHDVLLSISGWYVFFCKVCFLVGFVFLWVVLFLIFSIGCTRSIFVRFQFYK